MKIETLLRLIEDFIELKKAIMELINAYTEKKDRKDVEEALNRGDLAKLSQFLGLYFDKSNREPGFEPWPGGSNNKDNG